MIDELRDSGARAFVANEPKAALSAPTDMREALARQIANAKPGHDSFGSFGPDGLVLHVSRGQRDFLLADLSAPQGEDVIRRAKDALDARLDNYLSEMKEGYDDSIVGFNQAWDVMRKVFEELCGAPQ